MVQNRGRALENTNLRFVPSPKSSGATTNHLTLLKDALRYQARYGRASCNTDSMFSFMYAKGSMRLDSADWVIWITELSTEIRQRSERRSISESNPSRPFSRPPMCCWAKIPLRSGENPLRRGLGHGRDWPRRAQK